MTKEEAINVLNDYDINFEGHTAEEIAEAHEIAIKAIRTIPSEDCISRQAVLDALHSYFTEGFNEDRWWNSTHVLNAINKVPSIAPQSKTGHWIYSKAVNTGEIIWSKCSKCGNEERGCAQRMKYCPECGAKMQEEKK